MRRRALVTGATRGIGKQIAIELARAGFDVAFTGRTVREGEGREEDDAGRATPLPGSLESTRALVEAAGVAALPLCVDLLDPAALDAAIARIESTWGGVDLLVNNAMYEQGRYTNAWILETPREEWGHKLQANFLAPLALVQAFLPGMIAARQGCIINLSTRHNYTKQAGPPGQGGAGVSYNCSKAALGKLADGIAAEHGRDGVLAFDLDPGPVWTERGERQHTRIGYPRAIFCPIEVPAKAVAWLATDPEAARYNGQHFMAQEFVLQRGLFPKWETALRLNERWSPTAILDWRERRSEIG